MSDIKIKMITDSAADIPPALQRELGIQVLPFMIAMEGKEYRDGVDFQPEEFYEILAQAPRIPTHSQLNPTVFTDCYEKAWEEGYTDLIYAAINAKGSSTYQNALMAREQFYEDHPRAREGFAIHILDTKIYTMGYGYAVVQGARMARAGASVAEVMAYLEDWVDHVRVIFAPYDLKFAKKSGRVSVAAAFVGEALGLKPIMTFEQGQSKILSKVRGEKNIIPALIELCQKEREPGTPYLCVNGSLKERNLELRDSCTAALGQPPEMECLVGGVIAINAGPNLVGLIYRARA